MGSGYPTDHDALPILVVSGMWVANVRPHTPDLKPTYSTSPISLAPIIQYPEEKLILCNPPPPQYESEKEDDEGEVFGSGRGGEFKKEQWRRNDPY